MSLFKALFSRKWIIPTIVALLGMALLAWLGFWQLDRLEQRRAANAALEAVLASPPISLTGEPLPETPEELRNREVIVSGTYDLDNQILLKLQNWQGRTGVHLLTPLLIEGRDTAVLIDRGWIPQEAVEAGDVPMFDETGPVTVSGYVALPQTLSKSTPTDTFQPEIYRVDVAAVNSWLPYELYPFYVIQSPDGNEELPFQVEREIDLSEGPHMGYALQWFAFTLMLGGGYLAFVQRSLKKKEV
ncbi:MAG: SURF1 family protein [Chloroflexi bacterium]|nr:SURF1 family protein [Chloroflexota bacterium]